MSRDVDERMRADAVALWERWAHRRYPRDLGDEGGWDATLVDEWLAEIRAAVLANGDVR